MTRATGEDFFARVVVGGVWVLVALLVCAPFLLIGAIVFAVMRILGWI